MLAIIAEKLNKDLKHATSINFTVLNNNSFTRITREILILGYYKKKRRITIFHNLSLVHFIYATNTFSNWLLKLLEFNIRTCNHLLITYQGEIEF